MLVKQIDVVRPESFERAVDGCLHAFLPAVDAGDRAVLNTKAKLGCDDNTVARAPELLLGARNQFFTYMRPLDFGRIENRASEFDGTVNGGTATKVRPRDGMKHAYGARYT